MDLHVVQISSPVGPWGVEGTALAITRVFMPHEVYRVSRGSGPVLVTDTATQLSEYFAGSRRSFDVPLGDVRATAFQLEVWAALRDIPYGQVRTYSDVAAAVRRPLAVRAVGNANGANPWPVVVPCHRVVARDGLGGYGGGTDVKRFLLDLEGARVA